MGSIVSGSGLTEQEVRRTNDSSISIHAPRAGSDDKPVMFCGKDFVISIHAPRAGSDGRLGSKCVVERRFQSMLPVRGATILVTAQTAKNLERLASMCGYREIGMVVDKLTREKMISLHTDALMPGERKGKQIWDTGVTARNMRSGPVTT